MDVIWIDFAVIFASLGGLMIEFFFLYRKVDRLITSHQRLIDLMLRGKTVEDFHEIIEESKTIEERQQKLEKRVWDLEQS